MIDKFNNKSVNIGGIKKWFKITITLVIILIITYNIFLIYTLTGVETGKIINFINKPDSLDKNSFNDFIKIKNEKKDKIKKWLNFWKKIKVFSEIIYYFFSIKCINFINYCSCKIFHYNMIQESFNIKYKIFNTYSYNPSINSAFVYNERSLINGQNVSYIKGNGINYLRLMSIDPLINNNQNVYSLRDFRRINNYLTNSIFQCELSIKNTIKVFFLTSLLGLIFIKKPLDQLINSANLFLEILN